MKINTLVKKYFSFNYYINKSQQTKLW